MKIVVRSYLKVACIHNETRGSQSGRKTRDSAESNVLSLWHLL
jgi:hypothetical protein